MKRIFTLLIITLLSLNSSVKAQLLAGQCESSPCNARTICSVNTAVAQSYTSTGNPGGLTNCVNCTGASVAYAGNWVYFQFKCYTAGTLQFTLTPNDPFSNLNWAIWNSTTTGCSGINNAGIVECNTVATNGATGIGAACAGTFEPPLNLIAGNTYILGVSRSTGGATAGTTGFVLNTAGGTAVIIDPTQTQIASVVPFNICNPVDTIKLKLSKHVRCAQVGVGDIIVLNGATNYPTSTTAGASCSTACVNPINTGLNYATLTDTIVLTFPSSLPPGNYTANINTNAFLDACAQGPNNTATVSFTVPSLLKDSIRTGYNCTLQKYIDTLYAVGGVGPYTFSLDGGAFVGPTIPGGNYRVYSGLNGGQFYTFTSKDANGCTKDSLKFHNPVVPLTGMNLSTSKNPPCNNEFAKDTVRVSNIIGGVPPYSYSIAGPGVAGMINVSPGVWANGVWAGANATYTVTITDALGCTVVGLKSMFNPSVLSITTITATNPFCFGDSTGSFYLQGTGGTFPYTYSILPNYAPPMGQILAPPGVTFDSIPAGTYTMRITDANGCFKDTVRTLTSSPAIIIKNYNGTPVAPFTAAAPTPVFFNPTCPNPCSGWIKPYAIGGVGGVNTKKYYLLPLISAGVYTDSATSTTQFNNLCQGTYTVLARDVAGCTSTATFTLALPPIPTIDTLSITHPLCFGGLGSIATNVVGGTGPYTNIMYTAIPSLTATASGVGGVFGTYNNVPSGTYTLIITDVNSCKDSVFNITVIDPPQLQWGTITPTNILCNTFNTGAISASTTGGTGSINYIISPLGPQTQLTANGGTGIFINLTAQCYTITATDGNGCSITSQVCLTQPPLLTIAPSNIVNTSCNSVCDGSATITNNGGGVALYSYTINNGGTIDPLTGVASALCDGTYTVTILDANLCTATTSFTITEPAPLNLVSALDSNTSCNGVCDGGGTFTPSGGTAPFSYLIVGTGTPSVTTPGATGVATNLCAGTYTVTVVDANLCQATATILITQPALLTAVSLTLNNVLCNGDSNGTGTVTPSGGTAPYNYSINGPGTSALITTPGAIGNATGLQFGTYTITVTDANACSTTATISITAPAVFTVDTTTTSQVSCTNGCDGSITMTFAGGTPGVSYSISPNTNPICGAIVQAGNVFTNLQANTYTITGTDLNGCTATKTVTITQPNLLVLTASGVTNILNCFGGCNGVASITNNGGTNPISYSINPPNIPCTAAQLSNGVFSNLGANVYIVTGTDANFCNATVSFVIGQPLPVSVSYTPSIIPTCTPGCDGTGTGIGSGGTAPYGYSISGGITINATTGVISGVCAGTNYIITVTDANGCTAVTNFTMTTPGGPTITLSGQTNATCFGYCDGEIVATANVTAIAPIIWSIAPSGIIDPSTGVATNLCAGTSYAITATDANSCVGTISFSITEPVQLTAVGAMTLSVDCFGNATGTGTATPSGGTSPYTYTSITGTGTPIITVGPSAVGNASVLSAGAYLVTVTDATNVCTTTTTINITQPSQFSIDTLSTVNANCFNSCNGSITMTFAGGTPGVTYVISPNTNAICGAVVQVANIFTNLQANTYIVTGTDASGCTATKSVTITEPNLLVLSPNVDSNVSCFNGCDGGATVSFVGGTGTVSYTINPNNIPCPVSQLTAGVFTNLGANTYTVTGTDANGCTATTSFTITQPFTQLSVSFTPGTSPTCTPGCDGTGTGVALGGTTPYNYTITGGIIINPLTGAVSGICASTNYTITVTDANGCTATTNFTMVAPNSPSLSLNISTQPTCVPGCDGTATFNTVGGTPLYTYTILPSGTINAANGDASALCTGITYTITVTDANTCSGSTTVQVFPPAGTPINVASTTDATCAPGCDGTVTLNPVLGIGYTISPAVLPAIVGNVITGLCAGTTYTITGTDINGCTDTTTVQIGTLLATPINVASTTDATCVPGCDGTVTLNPALGIVYTISPAVVPAIVGNVITGLCAGTTYTITGTNISGCPDTTTVQIGTLLATPINVASTTNASCVPGCDGTVTLNPAGLTYTISPAVIPAIVGNVISGLCAGTTYTITGTNASGCADTATVQVNTSGGPTLSVTSFTNASCTPGCDGTALMNPVGGTPLFTYTSNPTTLIAPVGNTFNGLCANTSYTIMVTDANSCTATATVQVGTAPGTPIATQSVSTVSCSPGCDGTIVMAPVAGVSYTVAPPAGITVVGNTISNLCANIAYTIIGTNLNLCTTDTIVTLVNPNAPICTIDSTHDASCNPGCDGQAFLTPSGGAAPYSYGITPAGPTAVGNVINGLCANIPYTITLTDAVGCSVVVNVTVGAPTPPTLTLVSWTNVAIAGNSTGQIVTSASGGNGGLVYSLSPVNLPQAPNGTFNNLPAGIDTVTVTDNLGCTDTIQVIITSPLPLDYDSVSHTDVNCFGACTGTIYALAMGGVPGYTYSLNGTLNVPATSGSWTGLCAGTYTIQIKDANNATKDSIVTIIQTVQLAFDPAGIVKPSCIPGCDGSIAINATAGTGTAPYSYSIQSPLGSTCTVLQTLPGNFTQVGAGTYTITVTDVNGCTTTTTVLVNTVNGPTINSVIVTNLNCNNVCTGQLVINATGTPTLQYNIGGANQLSNTFATLCANTYTATVTDGNGCTATSVSTVSEPTALTIATASHTDVLCFGQISGSITMTITGGTTTLPYNYSINPASQPANTTGTFSPLGAGTYTVTASDANGCTITSSFTIAQPTALVWTSVIPNNVTCFGNADGNITANSTGGTGTITYSLNIAAFVAVGNYTGLTANNYTVTAKDANGCTISTIVSISESPQITLSAPVITNNLCNGASTGTISMIANGGTPGTPGSYAYNLMPGNISDSSGTFVGLPAGTNYAIIVTDGNGCTTVLSSIVVTHPPAIVFTQGIATNVTCFGQSSGAIQVASVGGTGVTNYSITPSLGLQSPPSYFGGLPAGLYIILGTDANGCTAQTVVNIAQPSEIQIINFVPIEPVCTGEINGKLVIQGGGGTAPYQYSLNGGPYQASDTFSNLASGIYTLRIQDGKGCTKDTVVTLLDPLIVGATFTIREPNCIGSEDGEIDVQGTGGRGGYKYYIKPGLFANKSGLFKGLAAGTYTLRVVDTSFCEYSVTFTINPNSNPMISAITKTDLGCYGKGNEGTATVNINGGTPPYTYLWQTNPVQTTATAANLYFGNYKVQITDGHGCVIEDSLYIQEGPCCDIAFIPNAFSPNGDGNNDEFRVLTTAGVELQQLEIRDRWGKKVWTTTDYRRGWDGQIDGKTGEIATYYYVLRYKCTLDGKTYIKKGDVVLVR